MRGWLSHLGTPRLPSLAATHDGQYRPPQSERAERQITWCLISSLRTVIVARWPIHGWRKGKREERTVEKRRGRMMGIEESVGPNGRGRVLVSFLTQTSPPLSSSGRPLSITPLLSASAPPLSTERRIQQRRPGRTGEHERDGGESTHEEDEDQRSTKRKQHSPSGRKDGLRAVGGNSAKRARSENSESRDSPSTSVSSYANSQYVSTRNLY